MAECESSIGGIALDQPQNLTNPKEGSLVARNREDTCYCARRRATATSWSTENFFLLKAVWGIYSATRSNAAYKRDGHRRTRAHHFRIVTNALKFCFIFHLTTLSFFKEKKKEQRSSLYSTVVQRSNCRTSRMQTQPHMLVITQFLTFY